MPTAKFTLRRYNIINDCLRSKLQRYWGIEDLSERLAQHDIEVTTRTIKNDLHDMRYDNELGYHAPIQYCALNRGYHYSERDYSIDKPRLTMYDLEILTILKHFAKAFAGLDCISGFDAVIDKVLLHCKYVAINNKIISAISIHDAFDDHIVKAMNIVLKAIYGGSSLDFTAKSETRSISFKPHALKMVNGSWYVVGADIIGGTIREVNLATVEWKHEQPTNQLSSD